MNFSPRKSLHFVIPTTFLFASACGSSHSHAHDPEAQLPGAPAQQIATAKCEHESQCGDVGMGQEYESMSRCQNDVTVEWRDDLNQYECPQGVSQSDLDECVAEIQAEECGNPIDDLARFTECMSSQICV